jgi:hypothetical protein
MALAHSAPAARRPFILAEIRFITVPPQDVSSFLRISPASRGRQPAPVFSKFCTTADLAPVVGNSAMVSGETGAAQGPRDPRANKPTIRKPESPFGYRSLFQRRIKVVTIDTRCEKASRNRPVVTDIRIEIAASAISAAREARPKSTE